MGLGNPSVANDGPVLEFGELDSVIRALSQCPDDSTQFESINDRSFHRIKKCLCLRVAERWLVSAVIIAVVVCKRG